MRKREGDGPRAGVIVGFVGKAVVGPLIGAKMRRFHVVAVAAVWRL